jgi:hypothetical protein
MGHHDAAFGQDQLDVMQAQAEDAIQLHGVADGLGRKPVPGIGGAFECNGVSVGWSSSQRQSRLTWAMPSQPPIVCTRRRNGKLGNARAIGDVRRQTAGLDQHRAWPYTPILASLVA